MFVYITDLVARECKCFPKIYCLSSGATTDNLPPGVLYQVKAAYKYQAEDMDELQFEVGEVMDVIEYEDPEEQVCRFRLQL